MARTDDEIWESTKKNYAKGINNKLNNMIKNANFSPNTERLVRTATRIINTDADGKLKFVASLTEKVKFSDGKGNSITSGYAEFMVHSYKLQKENPYYSVPTKNKWDSGFIQFLNIADEKGILESSSSRGIGNSTTSGSGK